MGRKKGPNRSIETRLTSVLRKAGDRGCWIRELSRRSGVKLSTTSKYVNHYLAGVVEDIDLGLIERIVRLSPTSSNQSVASNQRRRAKSQLCQARLPHPLSDKAAKLGLK